VRILWLGFVDPEQQRPYVRRLVAYLNEIADPGVEFAFSGLSPPDRYLHRITERRCSVQAIARSVEAEREGYSAVVLGHFQDAGLHDARAALEIPVVGLGEISILYACTLGFRVGLITIDPVFVPWHEEQVRSYALEQRVVGVRAMETDVDLFMRAFEAEDAYEEVLRQFEAQARLLVAAGVEVLIPAGGLPALLFRERRGFAVDGAVVLNATAVAAKQAEVAVKLRTLNGTGPSRAATFARPSEEALAEFLEHAGRAGAPSDVVLP
jgi:allantoin racemase